MSPSAQPRLGAPRRVAVTAVGALSPGGEGVNAYVAWQRGRTADTAAETIPGFDPARYVSSPKLLRSMHRSFQVVVASAVVAMRSAGLPAAASLAAGGIAPERAGIATALGDLSPLTADVLRVLAQSSAAGGAVDWGQFAELSLHQLHPFRRLTLLANMAAAHTSLLFGLQGPSFTFTSGAAAGAQTVTEAYWTIAAGHADLMLCQTAECPEQTFHPRPRAELGGAIVLEEYQRALDRGAPVLAEIAAPARPARFAPQEPELRHSPAASLMQTLPRAAAAGGAKIALDDLVAVAGAEMLKEAS